MGVVYKIKNVDIEPYIKDYQNNNISVREIAYATNLSTTSVYTLINKYLSDNGLEKSKIIYKKKKKNCFEKYVEQYENGTITIKQIMEKENYSESTIRNKIRDYYMESNKEHPKVERIYKRKDIHFDKYIKQYENREITIENIAKKENVSYATVQKYISKYYEEKNINIEQIRKNLSHKIDKNIEYFAQQYENGKISISKIAEKMKKDRIDTYNEIRNYYKIIGKKMPLEYTGKESIKYFLKHGLTPEQIKVEARKHNKIILDEQIEEILKEKNENER